MYNNNLVKWVISNFIKGIFCRLGIFVLIYIFVVYNEKDKFGLIIECNWGLLYFIGSFVYLLVFSSSGGGGGGGLFFGGGYDL